MWLWFVDEFRYQVACVQLEPSTDKTREEASCHVQVELEMRDP